VVETGIVLVVAQPEGATREMIVAIARPGDLLGPPGPDERLAALTDAAVTVVPGLAYRVLLGSPELAATVTERLLDAVCERQQSLARFATVDHRERVRQKLLQLARAHGRVGRDGVHLDLPLTHELLAQTTGSARETVTVALASLRRQGFVVRDGRRYRLLVQPDQVETPEPATIRGPCSTRSSTRSASSSSTSRRSAGARSGSRSAST
jgi:CRP-like cAMP-binding protein